EAWLHASGASPGEARLCRSLVRGMLLGDPARLSLLQLVEEVTAMGSGGPSGSFYRIAGGNDQLPRALAASLASPVRHGAVASRVERSAAGVRVVLRERGRLCAAAAEAAVVALPVPPLRALAFSPALPADLRRALATLGF